MNFRDQLRAQLIDHEGMRLKPYRCPAGKLTIGIGRNLDDMGITEAEAFVLFDNDIAVHVTELATALPWFGNLSRTRQIALIDMHFNLGHSRFMTFRKMLSALEAGDYSRAADEALNSRWAEQVGRRAATIAAQIRGLT